MIRPNRDTVVMVPRTGKLRKGDVCLYRVGKDLVLHRAIRPAGGGCWLIRGDGSGQGEIVAEDRVFAVMHSFYRDERQIDRKNLLYGAYSLGVVALNPLLKPYRRSRRALRRTAGKIRSLLFPTGRRDKKT